MNTLPLKSDKARIKAAIIEAWPELPDKFYARQIAQDSIVKMATEGVPYTDTVMRYARELKKEGKINYTVTCRRDGVYEKL